MGRPSKGRAVLNLGRVYCDLLFSGIETMPRLGREIFARDFTLAPGGGAVITAAHLAALSRPSALVARFGTDGLSALIEPDIAALGIDLRFLDRAASAGPQLTVAIAQGGDRAFLSHRAGPACPVSIEAALAWAEAGHLHIAEYATLHEIPDLVGRAKAQGLTVSLDPSWDDALIRDPRFFDLAAGIDLFLPNLSEAAALTGQPEPQAALKDLAAHFPVVAVKCGSDGAWLAGQGAVSHRPAQRVRVVDTTGAGDAFNAGFLHHWLDGARLDACLEAAILAGSRSVQVMGGTQGLTTCRMMQQSRTGTS